jgi:hypothetical protein
LSAEKYRLGAMAALKWFRKLIQDYEGPTGKLKSYLLREIELRETTADQFMVDLMNEFLKPTQKPKRRRKTKS